jgi:hypothetical protein
MIHQTSALFRYSVIIFCFVVGCSSGKEKEKNVSETNDTVQPDTTKQSMQDTVENPYVGLRKMAFEVTPEQLGLTLESTKTVVYGVIMDWGLSGGTASTVAYSTGDASLYLSSGGGVVGGGQHAQINLSAKQFVKTAQTYIHNAVLVTSAPLPVLNQVRFYFLTNKGVFGMDDNVENISGGYSTLKNLFDDGNEVMTGLRKTAEK